MLQLECPNCHVSLKHSPEMGGVFYVCPSCGGRSAGMMLLSKLGLSWNVYELLNAAAKKTAEPFARLCPHCSRKMKNCELPTTQGIMEVDVCSVCKQVWFDPSEFQGLELNAPVKAVPEPLPQTAKEALALAKIRYLETNKNTGIEGYAPSLDNLDSIGVDGPSDPLKYLAGLLGVPVEMDEEGLPGRPYFTWCTAFILLVVSVWTYEANSENNAIQNFGFISSEWMRFFGATVITSFFIHGGIFHLLSNLYFFWIFADNVENRMGSLKFILLLVFSHIAGLMLFALFDHRNIPTIGASGGIAGVLAYYAIMFPWARIGFCSRWGVWFTLPACLAFFIFVGLQVFGASEQMSGYGGINYLGHLGGIFVGVFAAIVSRLRPPKESLQDVQPTPVPVEEPVTETEKTAAPEEKDSADIPVVSKEYNPDDYKR